MSDQKTCVASSSATSSPESADGHLPLNSPESRMISRCGREVLRASLSVWLAQASGQEIHVTWLRPFSISLQSVALQSSLASRLGPQLKKTTGLMLYSLNWKRKVTPAGRMYYQLQASARRTSVTEYFLERRGWTTASYSDGQRGGQGITSGMTGSSLAQQAKMAHWSTPRIGGESERAETWLERKKLEYEIAPGKGIGAPAVGVQAQLASWHTPISNDARGSDYSTSAGKKILKLGGEAKMATWPTTGCSDERSTAPQEALNGWYRENGTKIQKRLQDVAATANWPTASATDHKGGYQGGRIRNGKLSVDRLDVAAQLVMPDYPIRITTNGEVLTGSSAGMSVSGQLNPEHSRWLMGYPAAWGYSKDMVTPSYLKSQPGSSANLLSQLMRLTEAIFRNRISREKLCQI